MVVRMTVSKISLHDLAHALRTTKIELTGTLTEVRVRSTVEPPGKHLATVVLLLNEPLCAVRKLRCIVFSEVYEACASSLRGGRKVRVTGEFLISGTRRQPALRVHALLPMGRLAKRQPRASHERTRG